MNLRVLDLHCDTATGLLGHGSHPRTRLASRAGHIDLDRGGRLPGYAQFFAVFTTTLFGDAPAIFDAAVANFRAELEENKDRIAHARTPGEAEAIVESGRIAAVFTIEGPAGIRFDPGRLAELADRGLAMTTLGWNENNPLAGSHATGGGLTAQGREYVRTAQAHGVAIDVSHLSERAFWNIMDMTQAPVSASHSNSRAVHGVSRNLTDEQFKAIAASGGVAGLNLYNDFLGAEPVTLDTVCDHVLHWLDLGGEKAIALGGDLDGCEAVPQGFTGVDCYPGLAQALLNRGVPEPIVEDIFWNNAMRMWKACAMSRP